MKIMYMIGSLTIGGAESIVTNYLIQLKKAGQEVVLLQMEDKHTFLNQRLDQEGIRVLTVCNKPETGIFSKMVTVWKLCSMIAKEKPDLLHVHTGLEKFRYIRYPAERIVYTVHSEWKRCVNQGKNHRKMLFRLIQKGMTVIVLSEKAKQDVTDRFPDARVYRIPNGFDFEEIRKQRCDRNELLRSLQIPETSFVLGHVGRFHAVKNHEKIVSVFCKVLERRADAHLVLVGSGSREEEHRVRELVTKSGVAERIHLLGERKDAVAVMSAFDCLLLPSYSEAFPLVLIEAQTLGIRAVVSAGVSEDACVNQNCLRLPLEETDDVWAEYILGDCTARKKYELSQYDMTKVIEQHLHLYASLCK